MSQMICIIGTDGSGKTTLSDSVVAALKARGTKAERVWLGAESYLMAPARRLLKLLWKRNEQGEGSGLQQPVKRTTTSTHNYRAEIARKNALAKRYRWAVSAYLALVWLDYRLQVTIKRWRQRDQEVIVADRYLFDVCVNLGLTLGWSPDKVVAFARSRLAKMQLPQFRVFLRVEPEISFSRKDDIPDIEYLRLRFSYYAAIARAFGFVERDGTLSIEENRDWLLEMSGHEARIPYVIYVHANNTDVGGADKVLALMAHHMRDFGRPEGGLRVTTCLRLQTAIVESYAAAGIPVIHHPFVRPQTSRGITGLAGLILQAPGSLWFFWRLFGREQPDIVHVNDLYDILPALAARLRHIPVVWHIRMIKTNPRMRDLFTWAVRHLATVSISVSAAVRDHYFPRLTPGHLAVVIHDLGSATLIADNRDPTETAPRPEGLPAKGRLVLMVGRIEPWKGQSIFVKAVARLPAKLRDSNVFALVGDGVESKEDYLAEVTHEAKSVGILMLGHREDIPTLLRAADISVHASIEPDPFPGVVVESLLAGTATIASASGGSAEMIRDTFDGLLVQSGNIDLLKQAMTGLLEAELPPRKRFGSAGRSRGLSLVDAPVVDSAISEVYSTVLHAK